MKASYPLIETIVVSIVAAFILGFIAKRFKLPSILGYLIAGVLIGPHTPGVVADPVLASQLSEIGVILLMFGVGLHFSPSDLFNIRKIALPGAIVQIMMATLAGCLYALPKDYGLTEGLIFGLSLSVASTVVLLRALEQHRAIDTQAGKIAIGWLVVEDVVMILAIVLLPLAASVINKGGNLSLLDVFSSIAIILVKISVFVTLMMVIGRKLLPPLLMKIAKMKSRELTSLGVISIALGFAFAAHEFFDASFALGAFFAGLVLNESDIGAKAAEQTVPLKDIFAVLFFVAVGMLFDPTILLRDPFSVLGALFIVIVVKAFSALCITYFFKQPRETGMLVAISLAQIGEFSFIFAGMARQFNLLQPELYDIILACAILSIALNPFLFAFLKKKSHRNGRKAIA